MAKDNFPTQDIDVFISYKREERGLAVQLGRALNNVGYSFVTDIDLETDEHFADAVDKRLRRSRLILVLWTRKAAASTWVRNEARFGVRRKCYMGVELEDLGLEMAADLDGLNRDVIAAGRPLRTILPEIMTAVTKKLGDGGTPISDASDEELDFAADNMAFETAQRVDTKDAYLEYLARFPNGYMAKQARQRRDRAGTPGDWLGKNKVYLLTLVAALTGVGALGLEAVKEQKAAGDLTLSEESALRTQRDKFETTAGDLQGKLTAAQTAGATVTAKQAQIDRLTKQRDDLNGTVTTLEKSHATAMAKAATEHSAALNALRKQANDQTAQKIAALEKSHATALAAAAADRTPQPTTSPAIPAPDCGAYDGNRGYWLPGNYGVDQQCISVAETSLDLRASDMTDADMPKLSGLTALETLYLTNTQVSGISALKSLTALESLSLDNTQVSDISALKGLTALEWLFLANTQVSDISALKGMTALEKLSLYNTQVSDTSALKGMTALKWLSLNNTQVSDVAPLQSLTGLHQLWLPDGTRIGLYDVNSPETRAAVQEAIATWSP